MAMRQSSRLAAGTPLTAALWLAAIAAPPAAAAPAGQQYRSVLDICRFRESQLIQYNIVLAAKNKALAAATVPAQQNSLAADVQAVKQGLEGVEGSWQRMDCSRLVYPNPSMLGR